MFDMFRTQCIKWVFLRLLWHVENRNIDLFLPAMLLANWNEMFRRNVLFMPVLSGPMFNYIVLILYRQVHPNNSEHCWSNERTIWLWYLFSCCSCWIPRKKHISSGFSGKFDYFSGYSRKSRVSAHFFVPIPGIFKTGKYRNAEIAVVWPQQRL